MGNCRDCKHWLRTHVQIRVRTNERVATAVAALRLGHADTALGALLASPATEEFCRCLASRDMVHGSLDTKPDFGCVLWESK